MFVAEGRMMGVYVSTCPQSEQAINNYSDTLIQRSEERQHQVTSYHHSMTAADRIGSHKGGAKGATNLPSSENSKARPKVLEALPRRISTRLQDGFSVNLRNLFLDVPVLLQLPQDISVYLSLRVRHLDRPEGGPGRLHLNKRKCLWWILLIPTLKSSTWACEVRFLRDEAIAVSV